MTDAAAPQKVDPVVFVNPKALHGGRGFLEKAIAKAQRGDISEPFCAALNRYLFNAGVMAWDDERALFWVRHPSAGWQVAVWLMAVASQFEPQESKAA